MDVPLWTALAVGAKHLRGRADWAIRSWDSIAAQLTDPADPHPCHFGVQSQHLGTNWFTVVDDRLPARFGVEVFARTLLHFANVARTGTPRQSLIAMIGPPDPAATLATHHSRFWDLLNELGALDTAPWPRTVPADTLDPDWQWCFGGEPWFIFAASPAYRARRSRSLGDSLTVVFQTRRVFEGLSGSTAAGQAAKRRIRARQLRYDEVPSHPFLGDPAFSSTNKWLQYALPDDQDTTVGSCPVRRDGVTA